MASYVGCHVSIREGYLGAARQAHRMGAESFQFFPKNPRSLALKTPDWHDAAACRAYCREHGLKSIAHSAYLINMAVEEGELQRQMVASLLGDLVIAEACGAIGVVVHFGHVSGERAQANLLQAYQNIIQCINNVLKVWEGEALLLLENQAGEGGLMGTTLEELVNIRRLCSAPERVGFCLDTCHAFASGLWTPGNTSGLLSLMAETGYGAELKAVHVNDSVYPWSKRKDRHAAMGRGHIGQEMLGDLLRDSLFEGLPLVLETPSEPDYGHEAQMKSLRSSLYPDAVR
ncbi:deoxyribonuclease IV [Paenibacillus sp. y28]|uniref:deoxyribonuclease IV n=1 Tax=Paenibacillus sp. y28 TaxID=3129110 RepID=UPI0030175F8C